VRHQTATMLFLVAPHKVPRQVLPLQLTFLQRHFAIVNSAFRLFNFGEVWRENARDRCLGFLGRCDTIRIERIMSHLSSKTNQSKALTQMSVQCSLALTATKLCQCKYHFTFKKNMFYAIKSSISQYLPKCIMTEPML
jgi:hypothetical protein